jgi:LysR family glycine cleavage system transcriptional activator
MPGSSVNLPSTTALRAFDAAARHASFTGAANELGLTQGAVSHQIRELESRLGVSLFEREARGIGLTAAGVTYLPFVREALQRLRTGQQMLNPSSGEKIVTVSCSPNFAQKWLVPRLGTFLQENSDLDCRISAAAAHITFQSDGIDLAVRHGDGHWPELAVTRLCSETIFPVCSPHLDPKLSTLESVDELNQYPLIHDQQREGWQVWLKERGANTKGFDLSRGPVLNQTSLAIDAAVACQGVALARSALVQLDLDAGRLIRPLPDQTQADFAYWIVCPPEHLAREPVARFKQWLLDQVS